MLTPGLAAVVILIFAGALALIERRVARLERVQARQNRPRPVAVTPRYLGRVNTTQRLARGFREQD